MGSRSRHPSGAVFEVGWCGEKKDARCDREGRLESGCCASVDDLGGPQRDCDPGHASQGRRQRLRGRRYSGPARATIGATTHYKTPPREHTLGRERRAAREQASTASGKVLASCHQDNIKFPATQAHPALGREMDSASQDKLKDMPMERDGRGGQSGCRCTGRGALVGGNRRRPVNPDTNEKLFSARAATRRVRAGDGKQGQHTKKVSRNVDLPNVSRVCCRCEPGWMRMGNVGGGEMSVRGEAKRRAGGSEKEETRRLDCARQSRCNQEKPRLAT